jgi:hypothetical protein
VTRQQQQRRRGALLALTAGGGLLGSVWWVLGGWGPGSGSLLLFAGAAAIAELLPFEKARGRAMPMSVAVIAAFALLQHSPDELAIVATVGWMLEGGLRFWRRQHVRWAELLSRVVGAWSLGGLTALGHAVSLVTIPGLGLEILPTVLVVVAITLGLPLWEAVESTAKAGVPVRPVFLGLVESGWAGTVALSASALLGALVHPVLGAGTVPMIVLPLLAARVGLAKHALVRRTYDETVRAMSRLPEELGAVSRGHGVRVGELAVAVARELGLAQRDVEAVERAAHLHEVGRVRLEVLDPSEHDLALAGASVVREAGSLDEVADLIARVRDPYRLPHRGDDVSLPVGARIVRTMCDYDRVVSDGAPDRRPWDGLEHVSRGMAYDHDPEVIQALTRVLTRNGVI